MRKLRTNAQRRAACNPTIAIMRITLGSIVLGFAVTTLAPCSTFADAEIHHACLAPTRPMDTSDDAFWSAFMTDVETYRACISDYVQANHAAADLHRATANEATEQWNAFVRAELNVPEDFPWPPAE